MGELNVYRQLGIKPNFTQIGEKYGLHRQTVAKYYAGEGDRDRRRDKESTFDELKRRDREQGGDAGGPKRPYTSSCSIGTPTRRCPSTGLSRSTAGNGGSSLRPPPRPEPHPPFETPPGRQLQFDWKEGLRMVDANGEVFEFNVFSAVLGFSRSHRFVYSRTRTEDDLLACLLSTFVRFGGVPDEAITDNMAALVTFSGGRRVRSERAWRFAKEAGFELKLCRASTPQTKGKDESSNRFVNRLLAYDHDFEGEQGLIDAIARIEARSNAEPNETTGLPPAVLFMKEKEHLRPIGNLRVLQGMIGSVSVQKVPATMLVRAAGRQWSVPRSCIGKKVNVVAMPSGQVRVTLDGEEVAVHDTAAPGPIVYAEEHYVEALSGKSWFGDSDIREAARANLELLDRLGGE